MTQWMTFLVCALTVSFSNAQPTQLRIAAEDDWYPYSAKRGNNAEGRSVDIVKAAYEAVGVKLVLDVVPFNRGMILTKKGEYAGVFNAGLNNDVKRDYLVPDNDLATSEQVVIARVGQPYLGPKSFNGKRLSLTLGYTYPPEILNDDRNQIERAPYDSSNLKKVAADRADYTIIDRLVALSILETDPVVKSSLAIVGKLDPEKIHILFARSGTGENARRLFDQGMEKIRSNGELKAIIQRWEDKFR